MELFFFSFWGHNIYEIRNFYHLIKKDNSGQQHIALKWRGIFLRSMEVSNSSITNYVLLKKKKINPQNPLSNQQLKASV